MASEVKTDSPDAASMALHFDVAGRLTRVVALSGGNINDTYLAVCRTADGETGFIVQRLNRHVFASPEDVIHNMRVVTEHMGRRLAAEAPMADRVWRIPRVIPARGGGDLIVDGKGNYWRAMSLIVGAQTYEHIRDIGHAHEIGVALGQFQRSVSDIPVARLKDVLPGFHVTPRYLAAYDAASVSAPRQRRHAADVADCHAFVMQRRAWAAVLEDARGRGELLPRPIHGDPKVANVMIDDATGKGIGMIDLDTVSPGLVHYDFGDCLRSCCNPTGEDALDPGDVVFDTDLCAAVVKGYMTFAREFLTDADRHYLYDAIRLLTFELGVRFFADFLAGDHYFKTARAGHNLCRARVQFRLCESIERREATIRRVLEAHA